MKVRLIGLEGVTIANWELDETYPPDILYSVELRPARIYDKLMATDLPDLLEELPWKRIEYRLERRDGGGTYIYRRVTPI